MSRLLGPGYATPDGLYVRQGDGFRKLEPTLTPLGEAARELCEAIARGDVEPCPVCGRLGCDCDEWAELMYTDPIEVPPCPRCRRLNCNCASQPFDVDPHGDLSWRQSVEINY